MDGSSGGCLRMAVAEIASSGVSLRVRGVFGRGHDRDRIKFDLLPDRFVDQCGEAIYSSRERRGLVRCLEPKNGL